MNTAQRLNMIDDIIATAEPEFLRDWASAWLEGLSDEELREVNRAFVTREATTDAA